ncbi:serine hydrolase domain-containing protein [Planococcus sp. N028]|uniref:Serine hydrolase domain-containing protein n=1 Tax=Planococcus shixiaomingii TaxID=3058393 RepID=A0ABT8MXE0_9BACL|nr:serine hydrolase domain-containing protein [Planococcus sp. N028]MDN7240235.1 serine hydrolase domain-containing protein [Planococcus sp. N028]
MEKWIDAYQSNGYLHGAILVAKGDDVLLSEGFGMANVEHQAANSPKTKFRIGSITKGFTAMAIFQLYENKQLDINDLIDKYFPSYPNGNKITLYHCLTNSSGISNFTGATDFWSRKMRLPFTLSEMIDSFKQTELEFEPGHEYSYSSSGYLVLTAIIQKLSGHTYEEYMYDHIFLPLGMENTGVDNGRTVVPDLASGYSYWEALIHAEYADMSFPSGGYGIYSTTEDLLKWSRSLMDPVLISCETTAKMLKAYLNDYACGWSVAPQFGKHCLSHFGDVSGYASNFLQFTDDQITIIFLSNLSVSPVVDLTKELAKLIYGKPAMLPDPLKPINFEPDRELCGTYYFENEPDKSIEISFKDQGFFMTGPKMYGALYKFKLHLIERGTGELVFMTEGVHERLVISSGRTGVEFVFYTDCHGNNFCLKAYRGEKKGE